MSQSLREGNCGLAHFLGDIEYINSGGGRGWGGREVPPCWLLFSVLLLHVEHSYLFKYYSNSSDMAGVNADKQAIQDSLLNLERSGLKIE